ncbi:antiviral reverse transcriptase Drt3a [Psychrobacter faecalis]|uniref:antiviral reverse transcriptase Drt3a n=1 Tax=Psychrobacter faecalis TaxID=180588 RepID=UPI003FD68E7F
MLDQSINKSSLKYIINDFEQNLKFKSEFSNGTDVVVEQILSQYRKSESFSLLTVRDIKGRKAYQVEGVYPYYLLKRFNVTFKTINSLKQSNRNEIVSSIVALIKDKRPYSIIRLDIEQFYESVNRDIISDNLKQDIAYSKSTTNNLENWFDCFERSNVSGLPRGLNVSASLSEYYLRDFDKNVQRIEGVFYYARFVDDIIIFTTNEPENTIKEVETHLPKGLKFHQSNEKRDVLIIPKENNVNSNLEFNYLGYEFSIIIEKKKLTTKVNFSKKKVNNIKTKIVKSLLSFKENNDFSLLKSRVCFLTHNYYIHNKYRDTKIRSGIYYNYPFITHPEECRLNDLDDFLKELLFNSSSCKRVLGSMHGLSNQQQKILVRMRFSNGYIDKRFHKFTYRRMMQIKSCWSY